MATGGGSQDPSIKIWNTTNGKLIRSINAITQICSLVWSKLTKELISSHGVSNDIQLWSYPTLKHIHSLKGHTNKILHLALSPDGTTILSGSGNEVDETLRFWKVFEKIERKDEDNYDISNFILNNPKSELGKGFQMR